MAWPEQRRRVGRETYVLRWIDITIQPGELMVLQGRSGSGKTTLLNILVGLDMPSSGSVVLMARDLSTLGEEERTKVRRDYVGMIFQHAHLFPSLTAHELEYWYSGSLVFW
jgi:putative ABC transport system ATP-binding protein